MLADFFRNLIEIVGTAGEAIYHINRLRSKLVHGSRNAEQVRNECGEMKTDGILFINEIRDLLRRSILLFLKLMKENCEIAMSSDSGRKKLNAFLTSVVLGATNE